MADVEEEIFSCLSTATGLSALIGTRVYPTDVPQKATIPAVTYHRTSGLREHAMGADPGNTHSRFRVAYWHTAFEDALDGAAEVRTALSRYSVATGTVVEDCFLDNELHLYDFDRDAYAVAQDFTIHHQD